MIPPYEAIKGTMTYDQTMNYLCDSRELGFLEEGLAMVKKTYEIRKDILLELGPLNKRFLSLLESQKKAATEWDKILSACRKSPQALIACSDLEIDLPVLRKQMSAQFRPIFDQLEAECTKSSDPDSNLFRKDLCPRASERMRTIAYIWLLYLDERYLHKRAAK